MLNNNLVAKDQWQLHNIITTLSSRLLQQATFSRSSHFVSNATSKRSATTTQRLSQRTTQQYKTNNKRKRSNIKLQSSFLPLIQVAEGRYNNIERWLPNHPRRTHHLPLKHHLRLLEFSGRWMATSLHHPSCP